MVIAIRHDTLSAFMEDGRVPSLVTLIMGIHDA